MELKTSVLSVKDENGEWASIPALRGEKPVKGEDYWTDEDKQEIVDEVKAEVKSTDVQINGVSITGDGVANIPYASTKNAGVMKANRNYGLFHKGDGVISGYSVGTSQYENQDQDALVAKGTLENIKSDLTKRALIDDTQEEWTDAEKESAQRRLGILSSEGVGF